MNALNATILKNKIESRMGGGGGRGANKKALALKNVIDSVVCEHKKGAKADEPTLAVVVCEYKKVPKPTSRTLMRTALFTRRSKAASRSSTSATLIFFFDAFSRSEWSWR